MFRLILRKELKEPRIHFAIVCASVGCPPLRSEAYVAARLEEQLDDNARVFVKSDRVQVDRDAGRLGLSPILKWFAEDFGRTQAEKLRAISAYLPDRTSQQAAANGGGRISYLGYDWSLNDQKAPRTARR